MEWKVTYDGRKPPTARHQLFLNMWHLLVDLSDDTREGVLKYLFEWAEVERTVRKTHQVLDSGRLRELSTGKHIQIGSHTVTHPDLTALPPEEKLEELNGSRRTIEAMLDIQVNTISYPHGRYDLDTIELTRSAGYQLALGTGRSKYPDLDQLFQLSRRMIVDCEIDEFLGAIQ
jgi:peptidoglycan/xylan/chitin deacetylase (PgdA/CDA1 family)